MSEADDAHARKVRLAAALTEKARRSAVVADGVEHKRPVVTYPKVRWRIISDAEAKNVPFCVPSNDGEFAVLEYPHVHDDGIERWWPVSVQDIQS